jgi:hypothetical protein
VFPNWSRAVTWAAGLIVAPAPAVDGCPVKTSALAAAGITVTVVVWVRPTPLTVAETVFDSATVELSVPLATPFASVVAAGCDRVLPVLVAESTTVAPWIGLPSPSLAVTVIVDTLLPAVMEPAEAITVDCDAETLPAVIVNPVLVAAVSVPEIAVRVYPAPTLSMLKPPKPATPAVAL